MSTKIKDLPTFKRPREKLLEKGVSNVETEELLALILGSGTKKHNVITVARKILKQFTFTKDELPTIKQLTTIEGIGIKKACTVIAIFELVNRWSFPLPAHNITTPTDVLSHTHTIRTKQQEHLMVLYLNARSQLVDTQIVAIGRLNHLQLEARDIFHPAFISPCVAIILIHNHPSNDPQPSADDLSFTKRMKEAGKLLGIDVADHIIVTKDQHYSMREHNLFQNEK